MRDLVQSLLTGHGVLLPLGAFILLGAAVFAIASRLARYADAIADATGLGRVWIGTVLLAASTSLPELITGVNAVVLDVVDIGVGDLIGATLANMLVLALLDLSLARRRVLDNVSRDHALVGTLAIVLTAMAGAAIASRSWGSMGHIGWETIAIVTGYIVAMRAVYQTSQETAPPDQLELGETSRTVRREGRVGFGAATVGLLVTAPFLVMSAEAISVEAGLTRTFVGTLLVGVTTSLPEIATTVAAARIGALDLAVGNLFGSPAFNMCVLFAMDVAYLPGPLLAHVSPQNALTAHLAVLAVGLGLLGILARRGQRIGLVRIQSVLVVLAYAGAAWLLAVQ